MEEDRSAFKILTGKSIGKKPLERTRNRTDLKEIDKNTRIQFI